jgi:hypothetical protein
MLGAAAVHEERYDWVLLGHKTGAWGIGDVTSGETELLLREYHEVNAHLRANTTQFVNWFSFFLTFNLLAAAGFLVVNEHLPGLRGIAIEYGVPIVFLLLHILAFVGILTFRRYMTAAHCKLEAVAEQIGGTSRSPLPVRFYYWMTHLMAAGFVVSYFTWFFLLFIR